METNPSHIAHLITKRFKNEPLDPAEQRALKVWLEAHPKNKRLFDELMTKGVTMHVDWLDNLNSEAAWKRVEKSVRKKGYAPYFWQVAAVLAIVSSLCLALWLNTTNFASVDQPLVITEEHTGTEDVRPALLGAKIILANGQEVKVDDTLNITAGKSIIAPGLDLAETSSQRHDLYHTLVVPSANFFKITLADGTAVWVNAASELRFPEHFGEVERRVHLKGEAYFEVAKDAKRPFFVETEEVSVRVLGTHFNVSAYGKNVKTSLVEGRVEVSNDEHSAVIAPGQSAEWIQGRLNVKSTNLKRDLAWKNNVFFFQNDHIVNIANQLKRWYDIDVSLAQDVPLYHTYSGEIDRDVNLSEVLTMLEFVSDLKFTLNSNKLLITNKVKL